MYSMMRRNSSATWRLTVGKHVRRAVSPIINVCRCNCHNPEWRKMARHPEHKNCGECHAEIHRESAEFYRDYLEYIGCVEVSK